MSSIIDALKKSDQNRNNEQTAGVNNISFSDNPPPKSRRGFWLLVTFLLIVAGGVYAWQQGWHYQLKAYLTQNDSTATEPQADLKPVRQNKASAKPANSSQTTQPKSSTGNQLTPPKQSDIKAKSEQIQKEKLTQNAPDELKTISKNNRSTKPLKSTHEASVNADNSELTQHKPKQTKQDNDLVVKKAEPTPSSDSDSVTVKKKPLEPTLKQDYLLLHQIDFAIRKNIPPVKINIHIYDPDPENRMVLINGERYNIGDSIGDVLTVSDIVKEGIVVSYENLRFLIPK
ncbi:MAG: general secretion pathway protein GspB [Marinicella sp.]|nr:general secretion pathway protein GspB [Xanthomonadales bacterium]